MTMTKSQLEIDAMINEEVSIDEVMSELEAIFGDLEFVRIEEMEREIEFLEWIERIEENR